MIAAGASDQAVADRIGGISRMAVARHRQNHIERPAKAIVAAANKGKDVRDEREQIVAAAEAGDVAAAFLGIAEIAKDLKILRDRLERTADAAETDSQRLAVASLSGQQLRAAEVRARLGNVGGYAPPRGVPVIHPLSCSTSTSPAAIHSGSRARPLVDRRTRRFTRWLPCHYRWAAPPEQLAVACLVLPMGWTTTMGLKTTCK
jgi:hypothetical protein